MNEKILVVDDEIDTLRLVGLALQKHGFEIVVASDGAQGIAMAKSEKPDAIILDIMMPDMDGFEVTRQLRTDTATCEIPILMFSARTQLDDKVTGYEAGVDDYLTKPIHPSELVAHVNSLLNRSKQRSAVAAEQGHTIAIMAAKGGVGVSALSLNLAFSLRKSSKKDIIAAELTPGHGAWKIGQDRVFDEGLNTLLRLRIEEINKNVIKDELYQSDEGTQFLFTSSRLTDVELIKATNQLETIIKLMHSMAYITLLDLGSLVWTNCAKIFGFCQEALVVTGSHLSILERTHTFIDELREFEFGSKKPLKVALVESENGNTVPIHAAQEILKISDVYNVPPAAIMIEPGEDGNIPVVLKHPDSHYAQSIERLAQSIEAGISIRS